MTRPTPPPPIDSVLSDELLLRILTLLSARDLTTLHSVSANFHRLAGDGLLWKQLYYHDFVRPSLHPRTKDIACTSSASVPTLAGLKSLLLHQQLNLPPSLSGRRRLRGTNEGRQIRRLPARYHSSEEQVSGASGGLSEEQADQFVGGSRREALRNDGLDWQALYLVTLNWQAGRFVATELGSQQPPPERLPSPGDAMNGTIRTDASLPDEPGDGLTGNAIIDAPGADLSRTSVLPRPSPRQPTLVEASPNLVFTTRQRTRDIGSTSRISSHHDHLSVEVYLAHPDINSGKGLAAQRRPHDPTQNRPLVNIVPSSLLTYWKSSGIDPATIEVSDLRIDASTLGRDIVDEVDRKSFDEPGSRKRKLRENGRQDDSSASGHNKQQHDGVRLMVGYTTGDFAIFRVCAYGRGRLHRVEATEMLCHRSALSVHQKRSGAHRIATSAFHSPLLVTCTEDFKIAIYDIEDDDAGGEGGKASLVEQLSSYRSYWPACMLLKPLPHYDPRKTRRRRSSADAPRSSSSARRAHSNSLDERSAAFRLTVAYSTPVYPSSWSIGVQEVVLTLPPPLSGDAGGKGRCAVHIASRHAMARHTARATPIDPRGNHLFRGHSIYAPRERRLPWSDPRSVPASGPGELRPGLNSSSSPTSTSPLSANGARNRFTSISYDDPFIVLGAEDNVLEVFEVQGATTHIRSDDTYEPDDSAGRIGEGVRHGRRPGATATSTSSAGAALSLVHRGVCYGHTGSVLSVSLEDGRCVSGGSDGSVMVWSLGGERFDDSDSVLSLLRRYRRRGRTGGGGAGTASGAGARTRSSGRSASVASSSADTAAASVWQEDDEDVTDAMRHVVTLRAPLLVASTSTSGEARAVHLSSILEEQEVDEDDDDDADENTIDARIRRQESQARPNGSLGSQQSHPSHPPSSMGLSAAHTSLAASPVAQTSIRWVTTAFDKIVAVMSTRLLGGDGAKDDDDDDIGSLAPSATALGAVEERVQVWNFSR